MEAWRAVVRYRRAHLLKIINIGNEAKQRLPYSDSSLLIRERQQ
jgi:hypothetical protein